MPKSNIRHRKNPKTLAKDVMSTNLVVVSTDNTFRNAIEILTRNRLTVLPVVNERKELLGLLSEKDILGASKSFDQITRNFLDKPIRYQTEVKTVTPKTSLDEVGFLLANGPFRHIPVVSKEGVLEGIITRRDLIRVMYLRIEIKKNRKLIEI